MKCVGTHGECSEGKSGLGVKKCKDGKYRCDKCQQESSHIDDPQATASKLVQNELLCFLATSWPQYTSDDIKSKCLDFYTDDEIKDALQIISREYNVEFPNGSTSKGTEIMDGIIQILSASKPSELPTFVAVN